MMDIILPSILAIVFVLLGLGFSYGLTVVVLGTIASLCGNREAEMDLLRPIMKVMDFIITIGEKNKDYQTLRAV